MLICADQEGGQLLALAGTTAFPGNMALGAAGDEELARRVGAAIGCELALRLASYDLAIVGTIDAAARPGQAALIGELLRRSASVVAVALRLPYDLAAYPAAPTCLCTYSVLAPAMEALADGLFGCAPLVGRLPVTIPAHL